jgi:AcrR family transcriptional regulator
LSNPAAPPSGKEPKNERVREILAAALEEFFQQGFAAARLDAIAERAGIGKGTIYLYFDSKETLFEEAVRSVILPVIDRIETVALTPQGSAEMLLRAMITTFYRDVVATERRRLLRLLIAEGSRFPRLVSFYHAEVLTRGMAAIRHVLRYGVERGEFAPTAAVDYPQTIVGPAIVGAIWKLLFDDIEPIDLERLCDAHLDIVLRGLLSRAANA